MSFVDASVRTRTKTPRKLPVALPLERADQLTTTRAITISNMPGYTTVVIPEGTTVELIGETERTGLPRIRCLRYGVDDAIVTPESLTPVPVRPAT